MRRGPHPGPTGPRSRLRREHYAALFVLSAVLAVVAFALR